MKSEDRAMKMDQQILATSPDILDRINNVRAASTIAFILKQHKNICRGNKQSLAFGVRAGPSEYGNQVIKLPAGRRWHTHSSLAAGTSLKYRQEIKSGSKPHGQRDLKEETTAHNWCQQKLRAKRQIAADLEAQGELKHKPVAERAKKNCFP